MGGRQKPLTHLLFKASTKITAVSGRSALMSPTVSSAPIRPAREAPDPATSSVVIGVSTPTAANQIPYATNQLDGGDGQAGAGAQRRSGGRTVKSLPSVCGGFTFTAKPRPQDGHCVLSRGTKCPHIGQSRPFGRSISQISPQQIIPAAPRRHSPLIHRICISRSAPQRNLRLYSNPLQTAQSFPWAPFTLAGLAQPRHRRFTVADRPDRYQGSIAGARL